MPGVGPWHSTMARDRCFDLACRRDRKLEAIPESFILLGVVLAIPVLGIVAALIASRIPARRPDS